MSGDRKRGGHCAAGRHYDCSGHLGCECECHEVTGREVLGVVGELPDGPYLGVPVTGDAATELLREALATESARHGLASLNCYHRESDRMLPSARCVCGANLGWLKDLPDEASAYRLHIADALLPVVEAECRRRAAEEVEWAAATVADLAMERDDGPLEDVITALWQGAAKLRADAIEGRP